MEYKFVQTVQGPVVQGEDEILFFNQHTQLLDYADADPEFVEKAKKFIADGVSGIAADLAKSVFEPVLGGDLTAVLYGYLNALRFITDFERVYLPSVNKH